MSDLKPTSDSSPDHYFTARPSSPSAPREVSVELRGVRLSLLTDRGVFSYGEIDRASRLLATQMTLPPAGRILDWGAGYGFLGLLAAALCPDSQVTLVEVNERAAALADDNARRNGLGNVRVLTGEAPGVLGEERFETVISNPPLHVGRAAVLAVIDDAATRLTPGGELWLVVATSKGAKGFLAHMANHFAATRTVTISGGNRVLWARRAE
jgi:16S rRNA (guanine1207-N2)-methyltransferase